ncbi:MAG TPA: hypothetical protein VFQ61_01895 [Polyangiaceae bacterium]|nr:hypothetical protein [Polyangiaceae bacterium]
MRSTKALVSVLISSLALVLAAGCGDDDDDVVASGGKGGSSGGSGGSRAGSGGTGGRSGGATGTGSSSGGMGTSGGASSGGTLATGGATPTTGGVTSAGGSTGGQVNLGGTTAVLEGGSAGEAGVGGESGGSAGSGGSDPVGGGGAGGEAGAESGGTTSSGGTAPTGGTGGTSSGGTSSGGTSGGPDYCRGKCATDADCKNSKGSWGYCEPSTHYCRGTVLCDSATDCIPSASGWTVRCSAELACPNAGDVCVTAPTDKFQLGFCASPKPMDADCAAVDRSALTLKRFGTNQDVTVCANTTTQGCNAGVCTAKTCAADGECNASKGGSSCDEAKGFCECAADTDCGETGRTHCYTDTKRCGCSTDAECAQAGRTRICNLNTRACETVVACQDASACTSTYPNMVCE